MTSQNPGAPDGGWGWVVVGASFLNMVLLTSSFFAFPVLLVELADVFQTSTSAMALLGSIQSAVSFCFSVVAGALIHKFGNRPVSIAGFLAYSAALALSSCVNHIYVLYVTYGVIAGLGMSLGLSPAQVIVQQYFDKRRVLAAGFVICGMSVASLSSSPLMNLMVDTFGWRGAILLHSGIVLHGVILSTAFRPLPVPKKPSPIVKHTRSCTHSNGTSMHNNGTRAHSNGSTETPFLDTKYNQNPDSEINENHKHLLNEEEPSEHALQNGNDSVAIETPRGCCHGALRKVFMGFFDCSLWKERSFVVYTLGVLCLCFGSMTFPHHQVNFAVTLGTDRYYAAFAPTCVGVFSLASRLIFSFVSNLACVDRTLQFGLTTMAMGCIFCLSFLCQSYVHMLVMCACFGWCIGALEAIKSSVLVDLIGVARIAHAFGMFIMVTGFGVIMGSPLTGYLKDRTGGYAVPFSVLGCVVILGGVMITALALVRRRSARGTNADEEAEDNVSHRSLNDLSRVMSVSMTSINQ